MTRSAAPTLVHVVLTLLLLGCSHAPDEEVTAEVARRDAFAQKILEGSDAGRALHIGSSSDVHFQEGFSFIQFDPPEDFRGHAFRYMGQRGRVRLRTHGEHPMQLKLRGWMNEQVIRTRPNIACYVDAHLVTWIGPLATDGFFDLEMDVDPAVLAGHPWVTLEIAVSSVGFHFAEPPDLKVVLVSFLSWTEK